MANSALDGLLSYYQSLGVAQSTRRTYKAGVRAFQQFYTRYAIIPFPASLLTLRYFCCYMACQVSYKTIKVYLAGIWLEYLERGLEDPTKDELLHLLCTGIKRSQGVSKPKRLLITINVLQTLKLQLRNDSSLTPSRSGCYGQLLPWHFMASYELVNLPAPSFTWQHIHLSDDRYTILIEQSKTDPFRRGHIVNVHATGTSTCPVRAFRLYAEATTPLYDDEPVFKGGKFSPPDRQHLTSSIRYLLKNTQYSHQHYSSHSFRSGAATTAAAAGIPEWLIKILGRWRSNTYQVYIHSSPAMLQSIPSLLARANIPDTDAAPIQ